MELTPLCWILCQSHLASLIVNPNRTQFFEYDKISLSCEFQGNSTGWRLGRKTTKFSDCGTSGWGLRNGSSCKINVVPSDSGVYWCDSGSGVLSNTVNITVHGKNGHVILESPTDPVTEGQSVTLSCRHSTNPYNLKADFYKDGYFIRTEPTGEMTIPVVNKSDEGFYKCNNSIGESLEQTITVTDLTPPASLIIRPNTSQFFEYDPVYLSCEVKGSSAGWRLRRYTVNRRLSDCGSGWGKLEGSSCNINLALSDSGRYWCESWSGEHSNAAKITVHDGPVILVSPALPVTEGHSVTMRCRYKTTPSDLTADFYKDGSLIRTEPTGEMTIPVVTKSDEGLYKCSMSKEISPESLMTVADLTHLASLMVRPDRSQFFKDESVSLSCEVQGSSAGWILRRYTVNNRFSDCGTIWGKLEGSACNITVIPSDTGLYWCQFGSREHSNAVKIKVHGGPVILESPALPVTEGHSVTLRCRYQTPPSELTADFYKDRSLIRTESTGDMAIPVFNKSDEGLYSCRHSELGESPKSWMTVTATSPEMSISVPRLLCSLLVVSSYLMVTVVLLVKYSKSRRKT
ncbi:hypothetical protein UPYG_G00246880 [Umbra pygmaea]|uniref:Ig-like domain-containing protein n=1 Tax=Umbra pygmaea TaxID=75934 RepID=A0ABD0WGE4_UMBPY